VRKTIELAFATPFALPGELRLRLPAGWRGAFVGTDGPQDTLLIPDPVPGTPAALEVELVVPAGASDVAPVQLELSTAFEFAFDLPLLTVDPGEVTVERQTVDGAPAFTVSNGALRFDVLDGLSGSLVRLQDALGRAYLYDNAPEVQPWQFFENHVGGVQPIASGMHLDMIYGELDEMRAEPVQEGAWRGVEVSWTAIKDEYLRGQRFRLAYLTLPGSSVVRVRLRHQNFTPRRIEWFGGLGVNLLLAETPGSGEVEGTVVRAPGGRGTWTRNPAPKPFLNPGHLEQPWVNVLKGEQSLALLIPAGQHAAVQVIDFPQFVLGIPYGVLETGPQGEEAIEFALALNQGESEIRHLIAALGQG
jgi:hypothetical protein